MARKSSQQTQFWFHNGTALVQVSGIQDMSFSFPDPAEVDATGIDDSSSVTLAGIPGKRTFTITFFEDFAETDIDVMLALVGSGTERAVEIRYPQINANAKRAFSVIVVNAVPVVGRDAAMTIQFTLQLTTAITKTAS